MFKTIGIARGRGRGRLGGSLGLPFRVFALSAVLTFAFASAAFADTVTNLLDNSPAPTQFEEVRVNEGETRDVPLRVIAAGEDGEGGCNIGGSEVLQLGFNSTNDNIAREDPNGSTVAFQDGPDSGGEACGPNSSGGANPPVAAPDDRSITVRGVSRGAANVTVAQPPVRNTTGKGTYTYGAATFRVIVDNVAPTANNNAYNTNEDNVLTVNAPGVLGNDTDPGNNPLTAVLVSSTRNGTLQLRGDGSFVYTPNANFSGTDTFTYRASDGQAESGLATVTINVAPVNDRPDAAADALTTGEDQPAVVNVLANDTDVDGGPLTVTSNGQPQNGTVSCTPAGLCTYTPNPDFNGVDTFTYTVSDNNGATATGTVNVTVGGANDAPNARNNTYAVAEDGVLNVAGPGVLGNDTDPENDALTARVDRGPGNGTLDLNPDGSFAYTPGPNFNGSDSFTYQACDNGTPQICSEPATVSITVNAVNDAPVARGTTAALDEDTQVAVNALANDSDAEGNALTLTDFTQPQNGTVTCNPLGVCNYTPNPDFNGEDSFTYTVTDNNGGTGTATVRLTVRPVNDAPTARDNAYDATEDQPLRIDGPGVLGNDTDPENNRLRALLDTPPSNGTVTLLPDGSFVYVPNENFNGQDSFTYRANDDLADSNVATVTINVAPANDPPRAQPDTATTAEDAPTTVNVRANDTVGPADEGGQTLTVESIAAQPQNGAARVDGDGNVTYTPDANFNGTDTFTYRVCDDGDPRACDTATATVTVSPVNDAPRANDDEARTGEDDPALVDVLANDAAGPNNETGQTLTITNVTDPANGTAEVVLDGPNAGQVRYTPDPDYSGPDSFEYRVCDSGAPQQCATARVDVVVSAVNDAPRAEDDQRSVDEDAVLRFPAAELTQNDSPGAADESGQRLTVTEVDAPRNGTVRLDDNGQVVFRPDPDFSGDAGFTYTVCDNGGPRECRTADVSVNVNPVNDAPNARADEARVQEDGSTGINVLANDTDADGREDLDPTSVRVVEGPRNGTADVDPQTGEITYTPNPDFSGTDTLTYEVCDDQDVCDTATVSVTVIGVDDAPIARDDEGNTSVAALVANSYISQYAATRADEKTSFFRIDTSRRPYSFGRIGPGIPRPLNAIGYDSGSGPDGALYGYRLLRSPGIVRVDPETGASRYIGMPRGLPQAQYIAGDVSPNSDTYYLYASRSGVLRVVDLSTFRATAVRLDVAVDLADLAVNPTNGLLYGVSQDGRLVEIDPSSGQVNFKGVPEIDPGLFGAMWFTAEGDLIVYENGRKRETGGTLYQVRDPAGTPQVITREIGQATFGNDGAAFVSPPNPAGLSVEVDVLANDADPDDDLNPGSVRVTRQPDHGTTRVNGDGTVTYTTDETYDGSDSFGYEICDRRPVPVCDSATVTIRGGGIQLPGPLSNEATTSPTNRSAARRMSKK